MNPVATPPVSAGRRHYTLLVLTLLYTFSGFDRSVMWIMLEPIKNEFRLSDTELGWLSGFAFAAVYAIVGVPLGVVADRAVRTRMIAIAAAVWSFATLLCGFAANFWMLFLARMAVGAAESAAPPASVSVIADLYPRATRATATSVYLSATAVALVAAFALGGWISDRFGWRMGFIVAGTPGLVLACVALITLREPPRAASDARIPNTPGESLWTTCGYLWRTASTRYILMALTCCSVATVGISTFLTSLLVRSYGTRVGDAGFLAAFGFLIAAVCVPLIGYLSDRLGKRSLRWETWPPSLLCVFGLLASAVLAFSPRLSPLVLALPVLASATSAQVALAFSLMQGLVKPRMRATSMAIAYALQNLIGGGLGAVLVGLLSDTFAQHYRNESLRYAIATISLLFLAGAAFYALAARDIRLQRVVALGRSIES